MNNTKKKGFTPELASKFMGEDNNIYNGQDMSRIFLFGCLCGLLTALFFYLAVVVI